MKKIISSIKIEKPNVNDDTVILVEKNVKDGSQIKINQVLGVIETTKAALEIISDSNGYVNWLYDIGDTVAVNAVVCNIYQHSESSADFTKPNQRNSNHITKISKAAAKLIKLNDIDISLFGNKGLITEDMVKSLLKESNQKETSFDNFQKEMIKNITYANKSAVLAYVHGETNLNKNFDETSIIDHIIFSIFEIETRFTNFRLTYKKEMIDKTENFKLGLIHEENEMLSVLEMSKLNELASVDEYRKAKMKIIYDHYNNAKKGMAKPNIVLSHLEGKYTKSHQPILFPHSCATIATMLQNDKNSKKLSICIAYDHRLLNGNYVNKFLDLVLDTITKLSK